MTRRERREAKHARRDYNKESRWEVEWWKRFDHMFMRLKYPHSRYPWRLSAQARERKG